MGEAAEQISSPPEGQGAGESSGWLPEDLAGNPSLSKFESAGDLAKSYLEMESYRGNSIRIPGEDAGDDQRQEFYEKLIERVPGLMRTPNIEDPEAVGQIYRQLGAPEKAEDYQVPEVDAKGLKLDMSMAETFKNVAAKYGLTQKQFEGIVNDVTASNIETGLNQQDEYDQANAQLKGDWGNAYDQRMSQISKFAETTAAPPDLVMALRDGKVHAVTAKWLYGLMSQFAGESRQFDVPEQDRIMAPAEARVKIDEIYNNKEHPYWHPEQAGHEAAKSRMRKLYKQLEPDNKKINLSSGTAGSGGEVNIDL